MKIVTRSFSEWTPDCELPPEELVIWHARVDGGESALFHRQHLTAEENERAAKFRLERIRNQFTSTRGILRQLLAGYLGCKPTEVPIRYESAGKPILADKSFHFNVTHTENLALFAFSRMGRIGIDAEKLRSIENADSIIERFFSANEIEAYNRVAIERRERTFFQMWTRKEAVLKALGQGIHALELCEISVHPDEPPRVLRLFDDNCCADKWLLQDLEIVEGFAAALALEIGSK